MNQVLQDLSAPGLVTALENNMFGLFTHYGRASGRELYSEADLIRFFTGISFPFFNGVCRAQLHPDQLDDTITATLNYFTSRQVPMFWWTGPATQPPDLGKYLEVKGLNLVSQLSLMAIDLSTVQEEQSSPADLAIAQVNNSESLKDWVQVAMVGFEIPETEYHAFYDLELSLGIDSSRYIRFIGWRKNLPVVTSALYLDTQVAGIYVVATIPEARGQGFATALVLTALQKARTLGYHVATLQASQMGLNVYHRLGFQEYYRMGLYLWTGNSN